MDRPVFFNTGNHGHNLEISQDKLVVRYTADARHGHDVGAIQANSTVPTKCLIYYYEVTVTCAGAEGKIGVGFSDKSFKMTRQPGWEPNSYGYHGDDGRKYYANGRGEEYGPTFTTGDTIGAGIHMDKQEIFFTKNGVKLKTAFRSVKAAGNLYPTIGLHSKNESIEVNFGAKSFLFDLEGLIAEEHQQQRAEVDSTPLAPGAAHEMVRQYLLHYGYADTLAALDSASGISSTAAAASSSPAGVSLQLRSAVRKQILSGDIDSAQKLLQQHFPGVLQASDSSCSDACFWLSCQRYVELLRRGLVEEAVAYARAQLSGLQDKPQWRDTLRDVVGLVAYVQPEQSPLQHLLAVQQREHVADVVNTAVLQLQAQLAGQSNSMKGSALERLLQHVVALHAALHEENGGMGEQFQLEQHLLQS